MRKTNFLPNATRVTNVTLVLAGIVIILGAFTRLSDAGLGCPDWPGCYGNLIAPNSAKAWIEMIHRYAAGCLGGLILFNLIMHIKQYQQLHNTLLVSILLVALVIFQAILGMWTVTLGLYPVVVLAHLLGGMALLGMLWWQNLSLKPAMFIAKSAFTNVLCNICILIIILQLALGAWTSANYAAIVCADFPSCQGKLWPAMDFKAAFALFKIGVFDSPGTHLENTARVTIQMSHRIGALISFIFLSLLSWDLRKPQQGKLANKLAIILFLALCMQISLGITNVLAAIPMPIALLHNAGGAILLLILIRIKKCLTY